MQFGQYRFAVPRLSLSVLTLVLLITFIRLGVWQLDRADEKSLIQQQQQALRDSGEVTLAPAMLKSNKPADYQPASLKGRFDYAHQILIDNKIYNGRPGYHVVSPFVLEGTDTLILVNRGWVMASLDRSKLPVLENENNKHGELSGIVTIHGMVKYPSREFKLGNNTSNNKWPWRIQWLDTGDISKILKQPVADFIILQDKNNSDKFIRDWKVIVSPPEKNLSYAMQWFIMAIVLLIIYIVTNIKKVSSEHE